MSKRNLRALLCVACVLGAMSAWAGRDADRDVVAGCLKTHKAPFLVQEHLEKSQPIALTAIADVPETAMKLERRLAFPGAEGYGRFAKGGRGGDVYHVENLNDAGPGSLRDGIDSAQGPRTIVFSVSGTIELKSRLLIEKPYLTIAGQTAPGDGITLKDYNIHLRNTSHIIIRYMRLRLGDQNKGDEAPDVITADYCDNLILDHISASWGIDGIHDTRGCSNYTIQWCILSESLHDSIHPKGPHAMCGSFRAPLGNMSIHHNIFATSRDRHPTIGGSVKDPQWIIDFRNNVIYNWSGAANVCDNRVNIINNYFRPGPETDPMRGPIAMKASLPDKARGHMSGNFFEGRDDLTRNNYAALDFETWLGPESKYKYAGSLEDWKVDQPYNLGANSPMTQSAQEAYERVLTHGGASLKRDAVDIRFIQDVKNHQGKLLDSQDEVGGWPELKSAPAPKDTDCDGMPDAWENAHGLNPEDLTDGMQDRNGGGHTNLEAYLNSLTSAPLQANPEN
jgi:pectate lyase